MRKGRPEAESREKVFSTPSVRQCSSVQNQRLLTCRYQFFLQATEAQQVPINLTGTVRRMSYLFMHDMPWLGKACQASRWGGHQ